MLPFLLLAVLATPPAPLANEEDLPHLHCGVTQHCTIDASPATIELAYLPDPANWHAELHKDILFLRPTTCDTTTTRVTLRTSASRLYQLTATATCDSPPTDLHLASPLPPSVPAPVTSFTTITDYKVAFRGPITKYGIRKPRQIEVNHAATRIHLQPDLPSVPVVTDRTGRLLPNQEFDPDRTLLFVGEPLIDDHWILTFQANRRPPRIILKR